MTTVNYETSKDLLTKTIKYGDNEVIQLKARYSPDWKEWAVRYWKNGMLDDSRTYYAADQEDAIATMNVMVLTIKDTLEETHVKDDNAKLREALKDCITTAGALAGRSHRDAMRRLEAINDIVRTVLR